MNLRLAAPLLAAVLSSSVRAAEMNAALAESTVRSVPAYAAANLKSASVVSLEAARMLVALPYGSEAAQGIALGKNPDKEAVAIYLTDKKDFWVSVACALQAEEKRLGDAVDEAMMIEYGDYAAGDILLRQITIGRLATRAQAIATDAGADLVELESTSSTEFLQTLIERKKLLFSLLAAPIGR